MTDGDAMTDVKPYVSVHAHARATRLSGAWLRYRLVRCTGFVSRRAGFVTMLYLRHGMIYGSYTHTHTHTNYR